jgi:DNA-binding NarL/FixJ family response regulator
VIRVVLADDHPVVLGGLEQMLRVERDFQVVARCADGEEAINAVRTYQPDLAVLDFRMPRRDGLSVLREIRRSSPEVRVILLTAQLSKHEAEEAIAAGVDGIILKESALSVLVEAARAACSGKKWLDSPDLKLLLAGGAQGIDPDIATQLTTRESQIVMMIAERRGHAEVAATLGISESMLRVHLDRICRKANLSSVAEIASLAKRSAAAPVVKAMQPEAESPSAHVLRLQRRFGLTPREAAVAALLAEGCANKEIAERLKITINTVKTHVAAVHSKTEVSSTRRLLVLLRE